MHPYRDVSAKNRALYLKKCAWIDGVCKSNNPRQGVPASN